MLNERELGTVLAALRYWQARVEIRSGKWTQRTEFENDERMAAIDDIAGDTPLTIEEIDALCDRLNYSPEP